MLLLPLQLLLAAAGMAFEEVASSLRDKGCSRTLAVVGGGLAGMSVAYHAALADRSVGIAVFDVASPGAGGASAVAAGLLHPLTTRGGLIWLGHDAFETAAELVLTTQAHADAAAAQQGPPLPSSPPFCFARGVLRVARSDQQAQLFKATAERAARAAVEEGWGSEGGAEELMRWVDAPEAAALIGAGAAPADCAGGVWCPRGLCIDAPAYLRALWARTLELCAALWCECEEVSELAELCRTFDCVVVAVGARSTRVQGLEALPISLVRGRSLCWPAVPASACPRVGVLGGAYVNVLGGAEGGTLRVIGGATSERIERVEQADDEASSAALAELRADLRALWRAAELEAHVHGVGVRATPRRMRLGSVPLTGRVPGQRNAWFVTGLGGRGLLYHAELGRTVARAALGDDESALLVDTVSVPVLR